MSRWFYNIFITIISLILSFTSESKRYFFSRTGRLNSIDSPHCLLLPTDQYLYLEFLRRGEAQVRGNGPVAAHVTVGGAECGIILLFILGRDRN